MCLLSRYGAFPLLISLRKVAFLNLKYIYVTPLKFTLKLISSKEEIVISPQI